MLKKISYSILILFFISSLASCFFIRRFENNFFQEKKNHCSYDVISKPIHFSWARDSIGDYYETRAGIVIPLKIDTLPFSFYMQFDTGAPYSYIYEKDLNSLQALGISFKLIEIDQSNYVEELYFQLDTVNVRVKMIKVLKNYGHTFDLSDSTKSLVIGTIGSDFLSDRITEIDFSNQTLLLHQERPQQMQELGSFYPFDFTGRRIMLPVTLEGEEFEFFFDTGCSPFGLITTKNRFEAYTDPEIEAMKYDANSWGSGLPMVSKPSEVPFLIGNKELKLTLVSYLDKYTFTQPLVAPLTRIGGWLGNQPFMECTLILDTKSSEFTILSKERLN